MRWIHRPIKLNFPFDGAQEELERAPQGPFKVMTARPYYESSPSPGSAVRLLSEGRTRTFNPLSEDSGMVFHVWSMDDLEVEIIGDSPKWITVDTLWGETDSMCDPVSPLSPEQLEAFFHALIISDQWRHVNFVKDKNVEEMFEINGRRMAELMEESGLVPREAGRVAIMKVAEKFQGLNQPQN